MDSNGMTFLLAQEHAARDDAAAGVLGALFVGFILVVCLAVVVLVIAGTWKTFEKAGQPGWAAIVPIYNMVVMCEIAGRPGWWVLLMFIPCVGVVVEFIVLIDLAKRFGKDAVYGVLLAFFPCIFFPILGFGDSKYQAA